MCEISFVIFLISALVYVGIMIHDPRTLWSGFSFFWMLALFAMFLFFTVSQYSEQLASHDWHFNCTVCGGSRLCTGFSSAFDYYVLCGRNKASQARRGQADQFIVDALCHPSVRILGNLAQNRKSDRKYFRYSNLCDYQFFRNLYFGADGYVFLFCDPQLDTPEKEQEGGLYYCIGFIGTKVTPLLAARIEKGMDLLSANPNAMLIMSGGQGPGEDMPESEAMAAYAVDKGVDKRRIITETKSVSTQENLLFSRRLMEKENPKIVIITTAYHVFRALLLAKQQGIKCVGYGAKTKWYFTLNALLREFVGYLRLTWKKHTLVVGMVSAIVIVAKLVVWLK